mgnify:CR=1 FL=1
MYIPAQGGGGFWGDRVGAHLFGGPAAISFAEQENSDIVNGKIREDAPPAQLYNLEEDPSQKNNVINTYPEIAEDLQLLLDETISK